MPCSRSGTRSSSSSMPTPPLAAISDVDDARPAAPRSCTETTRPSRASSSVHSISFLPVNGSPTCTLGRLSWSRLVQILRGQHARAADAVAARRRAEQDDEVAGAGGARAHELVRAQQADAERVDERVLAVGRVEHGLARDVRDADAVAVAADAADDPAEQLARALLVERAEPQRVAQGDRARAHREDVAQDPAHSRGRALVRLDRGRVVVALDLERDREAVADVDHAGVLTRPLQHARAVRGQAAQLEAGVLVAAMLRPEQREDRQLEVVRRSLERSLDLRVLGVRQPEGTMERLLGRLCHAFT